MAWNIVRAYRSFFSRRAAMRRPYQMARRPWLEQLEDRLAPATVTWTGGSGNWTTAGDWTDNLGVHRVPGANDDVVINRSVAVTVTIDTQSVGSLQIGAKAKVALSGGANVTLSGPVTNDGTIQLTSQSANTAGNLTYSGNVTITGTGVVQSDKLTGDVYPLIVPANSASTLTLGDGPYLEGTILNKGTIDAAGGYVVVNGTVLTNEGTLQATSGGYLEDFSTIDNTNGRILINSGVLYYGGNTSVIQGGVWS
jgi:hypothetical protein